jgi:hypothetical protein
MTVAMVVTAAKRKSRFDISHTSDIVCFRVFKIRIKTFGWDRSVVCLEHVWMDRQTDRMTDTCCLCPQSVCAAWLQSCLPSHTFAT